VTDFGKTWSRKRRRTAAFNRLHRLIRCPHGIQTLLSNNRPFRHEDRLSEPAISQLVAVLQAPSAEAKVVSPTPYRSLQRLAPAMRLRDVQEVKGAAAAAGFAPAKREVSRCRRGNRSSYCRFTVKSCREAH